MEYILGSLTTALVIFVTNRILSTRASTLRFPMISQSSIYEKIGPLLPYARYLEPLPETQSRAHLASNNIKMLIMETKAYWIKNNQVFEADIIEGNVDQEGAVIVNTMQMNKVQLEEINFIVEKLTEGDNNDNGNTRHSKF